MTIPSGTAPSGAPHGEPAPRLQRGTPAFRRATLALGAAGFANFALLYCVQPLMPVFAAEFGVSPAVSSLSLSLTTGVLAPMLIVASSLSEGLGRKGLMSASILASALLTVLAALVPNFSELLVTRTLAGIVMSGLPAVTMAYLAEEIEGRAIGFAIGLVISGNALGGLAGRVIAGVLADYASWRVAIGGIGLFGLVAGLLVWRVLPPSRNFHRQRLDPATLARALFAHFRDPGLPWLFLLGFLLMGSFVLVYNYLGFRLLAPPYSLSQTAAGAIFTLYLVGIVSSTWMGQVGDRVGRRKVLWGTVIVALVGLGLTLAHDLRLIILGVAAVTVGYFGAHSIVSSWVSRRAQHAKAQASSVYLCACYVGSSVAGSVGGLAWSGGGWLGVVIAGAVLLGCALAISVRLTALAPLSESRSAA